MRGIVMNVRIVTVCRMFVNVNDSNIASSKILIRKTTSLDISAMTASEHLQTRAQRIREAGVLGRSELMQRLFDYLVDCSIADKAPKEVEIAIEVFGRNGGFEAAQDAMVRVYIHKLRRKLENYYAGAGRDEASRLMIPRGEYRLVFQESAVDVAINAAPPVIEATAEELASPNELASIEPITFRARVASSLQPHLNWGIAALAVLLVANVAVWVLSHRGEQKLDATLSEISAVRNQSVWRAILSDAAPVYIVVGDYYIFGELGSATPSNPEPVRRLIRDFSINSSRDLDDLIAMRPELADRYMDVALRYLPVSSAFALQRIAPLLQSNEPRQVQVVLASDLTPSMVRSADIIYIGLLSGMGMLRDIAFADSHFKIGDTYDELIDRKTNRIYVSQSTVAFNDNTSTRYRDYGYFSTLVGPSGKRIVILAGTRDVALMHTSEVVSRADSLAQLQKRTGGAENFEALYSVEGLDRTNLAGELLIAEAIDHRNSVASAPSAVPLASLQSR